MLNFFERLTAGLLLLVGLAKLITLVSGLPLLHANDPVLNVSNKLLFSIAGGMELFTAFYIICGKSITAKSFLCMALIIGIASYRISWVAAGQPAVCPCLGAVNDLLHLSESWLNAILLITFCALQTTVILQLRQLFVLQRSETSAITSN